MFDDLLNPVRTSPEATPVAKKTIELTTQVDPKSKAMWTTPFVSSSMKPIARGRTSVPFGRTYRTGANASRIAIERTATRAMPAQVQAPDRAARAGRGMASRRSVAGRSPPVSTAAGADLPPVLGGHARDLRRLGP